MGPFEAAGHRMIAGVSAGMLKFANDIMADSLDQCPQETGTLKRSSRVQLPYYEGNSVECTIGYGYGDEVNPVERKPANEYAVYVHELIEKYHVPPTKAKFLEDPVLEHAAEMGPVLAAYMRMGGGEYTTFSVLEGGEFIPVAPFFQGTMPLAGTEHAEWPADAD